MSGEAAAPAETARPRRIGLPGWIEYGLIPLANLAAAFLVAGLVVRFVGENPLEGVHILVWGASGAREETRLVFTRAERRRPINFRELLGCLRALEMFGERLRGRTVLMELDNTCAFEAARKLSWRSSALQLSLRAASWIGCSCLT